MEKERQKITKVNLDRCILLYFIVFTAKHAAFVFLRPLSSKFYGM